MGIFTGAHFLFHLLCAATNNICIPPMPPIVPELPPPGGDRLHYGSFPPVAPVTRIDSGWIEGHYIKTIRNRTLAAYEGIRYAQAPVGELRFREPRPYVGGDGQGSGVKSAKKYGNICLQLDTSQYYRIYGHEDCLFINVYTPRLDGFRVEEPEPKRLLPIVTFIHGGAHMFGTANFYGPAYLADSGRAILVTFNYRVGVLGYFSSGDDAAWGNFGLKDQAMAIDWIRTNARWFGGDGTRITLMGQSAGSASVGLHLVSHRTRDKVVGGILHSGDPLAHWALINRTQSNSMKLAALVGCKTDDGNSAATLRCLRKQNPNFLVEAQIRLYERLRYPLILFGPIVEPAHDLAYLIESPEMAYARGNVSRAPVLEGMVKDEGDFVSALAYIQFLNGPTSRDWNSSMKLALDLEDYDPVKVDNILTKIRQFYFHGSTRLSFSNRLELGRLFRDRLFTNGLRRGLQQRAAIQRSTWGFYFTHEGRHSVSETFGLRRQDWGVMHSDDLQYLLNSTQFFQPMRSTNRPDFDMMDFMLNVWTNFIEKQTPVFTHPDNGADIEFWEPVTSKMSSPPKVLNLHNNNGDILRKHPQMVEFPLETEHELWKSFHLKEF